MRLGHVGLMMFGQLVLGQLLENARQVRFSYVGKV